MFETLEAAVVKEGGAGLFCCFFVVVAASTVGDFVVSFCIFVSICHVLLVLIAAGHITCYHAVSNFLTASRTTSVSAATSKSY